jgi:hypothetical protein
MLETGRPRLRLAAHAEAALAYLDQTLHQLTLTATQTLARL